MKIGQRDFMWKSRPKSIFIAFSSIIIVFALLIDAVSGDHLVRTLTEEERPLQKKGARKHAPNRRLRKGHTLENIRGHADERGTAEQKGAADIDGSNAHYSDWGLLGQGWSMVGGHWAAGRGETPELILMQEATFTSSENEDSNLGTPRRSRGTKKWDAPASQKNKKRRKLMRTAQPRILRKGEVFKNGPSKVYDIGRDNEVQSTTGPKAAFENVDHILLPINQAFANGLSRPFQVNDRVDSNAGRGQQTANVESEPVISPNRLGRPLQLGQDGGGGGNGQPASMSSRPYQSNEVGKDQGVAGEVNKQPTSGFRRPYQSTEIEEDQGVEGSNNAQPTTSFSRPLQLEQAEENQGIMESEIQQTQSTEIEEDQGVQGSNNAQPATSSSRPLQSDQAEGDQGGTGSENQQTASSFTRPLDTELENDQPTSSFTRPLGSQVENDGFSRPLNLQQLENDQGTAVTGTEQASSGNGLGRPLQIDNNKNSDTEGGQGIVDEEDKNEQEGSQNGGKEEEMEEGEDEAEDENEENEDEDGDKDKNNNIDKDDDDGDQDEDDDGNDEEETSKGNVERDQGIDGEDDKNVQEDEDKDEDKDKNNNKDKEDDDGDKEDEEEDEEETNTGNIDNGQGEGKGGKNVSDNEGGETVDDLEREVEKELDTVAQDLQPGLMGRFQGVARTPVEAGSFNARNYRDFFRDIDDNAGDNSEKNAAEDAPVGGINGGLTDPAKDNNEKNLEKDDPHGDGGVTEEVGDAVVNEDEELTHETIPTEDTSVCQICSSGEAPTNLTKALMHSTLTCQDMMEELAVSSPDGCKQLKINVPVPIDLEAYCGCEGASFVSECTFCPEGTTNLYHSVTIPALNDWTCGAVEEYVAYISDEETCKSMGHLADLCCGTYDQYWHKSSANTASETQGGPSVGEDDSSRQ